MDIKKYNHIIYMDKDKNFIHFESVELCNKFKEWYSGSIGHTCCDGKGCLVIDASNNKQIHEIQNDFVKSLQTRVQFEREDSPKESVFQILMDSNKNGS